MINDIIVAFLDYTQVPLGPSLRYHHHTYCGTAPYFRFEGGVIFFVAGDGNTQPRLFATTTGRTIHDTGGGGCSLLSIVFFWVRFGVVPLLLSGMYYGTML